MKSCIIRILLCLAVSGQIAFAADQPMDTELSALAEKLASQVTDHAKKKVTVLDLTDLQGGSSELGRFIAEQLTVDLVIGKRAFSVLDRANLKSILAEHNLAATGLVNPENAKKLGSFSGVDALVLGTITPVSANIQITVKIIDTDTAEIIGAAKCTVPKTTEIIQLMTNSVVTTNGAATAPAGTTATPARTPEPVIDKNSQRIGDLMVKVESLRYTFDAYSYITATLFIQNLSSSSTTMAAVKSILLTNDRGDEFKSIQLTGISYVGYAGDVQEIAPQSSIRVTVKFQSTYYGDRAANYPPYRLQSEMNTAEVSRGQYLNTKSHTLLINIDKTK